MTLVLSILILSLAVGLLSIKIIVQKEGKFPSGHVSGNKAMQEKDISCHTSQHRIAQQKLNLSERLEARKKAGQN